MMQTVKQPSLLKIFGDNQYAWKLLEAQIYMQMHPIVSGQQIAKLLELYMKGVEKMNSISDQRESYFKNKVTSLMMNGTVIKSLKQNPMKKKKTAHEQPAKQTASKQQNIKHVQAEKKFQINHIELKQKQKQFQMRMAYTAHESNSDALKKLLIQQSYRQQNLSKRIDKIMMNHQQKLLERIKQRKLRTATYKAQSQINEQSQTQPSTNKFPSNRKQEAYFQSQVLVRQDQRKLNIKNENKSQKRKYKSLQKTNKQQNQLSIRKYSF